MIRRTSEFDGQSLARQAGLDLVLLEEAAVEAGLSRQAVRRAVAELRAGALEAADATPARRKGLGPDTVTVSRCVPGPFSDVDGILRRFLAKEQFHLRRDFGTNSLWTRRQDVGAWVKVQYDRSIHRRLMLRDVEQVEMAVVEEPGGSGMVMVKVTVDVKSILREHRQAIAKGAGAGLTAAALGAVVLGMPEAAVVVPGATASGMAIGYRLGAKRGRTTVENLTTRVEGFLDGVERRRQ